MSNLKGILSNSFRNVNIQGINHKIKYVKKGQTIQSAIDAITDASSTNQYLLIIPPGYYDQRVDAKDYVHLSGAGMDATYVSNDSQSGSASALTLSNCSDGVRIYISNMTFRKVTRASTVACIYWPDDGDERVAEFHNVKLLNEQQQSANMVQGQRYYDFTFYDCHTESIIDCFRPTSSGSNYAKLTFYNHHHIARENADPAYGSNLFVSLKTANTECYVFNSLIEGSSNYSGGEGPVAFKVTAEGKLRIYNTRINIQHTSVATRARGIVTHSSATGCDIEMHGGSINTNGGYDIYNGGDIAGIRLYGVRYSTHFGNLDTLCQGTIRSQGKSVTLSAAGTFGPDDGNIFIIDPGGAARNLNPAGQFQPFTDIKVINIADAAETITFEPTFTAAGAHDGLDNASVLTDSGESWVTNQLVGKTINNTTDGSSGTVTANTGTTVTATLSGGTDDDWDIGDNYTITPAGLNQAIAQNERAIFVYDGAGGWLKVFVG